MRFVIPGGLAALVLSSAPLDAQDSSSAAGPAVFSFSAEAGRSIKALWDESVATGQERVACLGATVNDGRVVVSRILPLEPEAADSLGVSAVSSIERCGPPEWSGTVHTHVALYTEDGPSRRFSGQDRVVMRLWYERWKADGVFCVVFSERDANCEADGVVGGLRSPPRVVR